MKNLIITTLLVCGVLVSTFSCELIKYDPIIGRWSVDHVTVEVLGSQIKLAFSEVDDTIKCPLENPLIFKTNNTFLWQLNKWNNPQKRCDPYSLVQSTWRKNGNLYMLEDGYENITLKLENNFLVWVLVGGKIIYYFKKE